MRQYRSSWKEVSIDSFSAEKKEVYMQRKNAVDLYIDGHPLKVVSEKTGLSGSEILRFIHKCIKVDSNQNQFGYAALIPRKRNEAANKKMNALFLEYPTLREFVLGNYFGDKKYTLEKNMNIRTLHTKFINECRRLGIQDYEYPFTLKDNGYYNLYLYIKNAETENQTLTIQRQDSNISQKFASTGYGESFGISCLHPYSVVQIDGHKIDMLYTVEVENEQGEIIRMPATRMWLIAIIDVSSRAILGYSISPYENYNQYDVLRAVYNAVAPHEKLIFSHEGFGYPQNGGFPSLAIPETQWAAFDMIMLDNAKAHLAKNAVTKLVHTIKSTVSFGSVATPETRGIVERFFKTLEMGGFHRLPGTTGSNPRDLKRGKPEKESVKFGITYTDIQELIEFLIAKYNNSAHSALENQTPLQVLERRIRQAGMKPYIIPYEDRKQVEKLTYFTEERILRGGYSTGSRPNISYMGVKYHAYKEEIPMDKIGEKVYAEINPDDLSHIDLYDKSGRYIANLVASGDWGKHSHSIKTRRAAMDRKQQNKEQNTLFSPELSIYEEELRKNSQSSRRERTKKAILESEKTISSKVKDNSKKGEEPEAKKEVFYSKEEIELIDSMSIEEAYEKGLI